MTITDSTRPPEALTDPGDLINFDALLTEDELALRSQVRAFVNEQIRPNIADWYERAYFPLEIVPEMAKLGLLGMHLSGYGCAGRSAVDYGLAGAELEAGDSGLRTFVSVQGSLAMSAIYKWGSEDQKTQWLPQMARGEAIGCFGLTEPTAGSDPSGMQTFARREGTDWVIDGTKRWIGLATVAKIAVIWARPTKGSAGSWSPPRPRVSRPRSSNRSCPCAHRSSARSNWTRCGSRPTRCSRKAQGLRGPFSCLNEARYGIMWGAMGAARDSFETALAYAQQRLQFDKPLAGYQLTQRKLVDMALEINKGFLLALHLGRLKDAGKLQHHQISVGKLNNVREAIKIAREARTILGGNGITLEYSPLRHANNLESVRTYEGTDEVHTLILGHQLTGIPAYR